MNVDTKIRFDLIQNNLTEATMFLDKARGLVVKKYASNEMEDRFFLALKRCILHLKEARKLGAPEDQIGEISNQLNALISSQLN
jgi:hypothetical protein